MATMTLCPRSRQAADNSTTFEMALTNVQFGVEKVLHELLVGSRSSGGSRQAVLPQVEQLARFFQKT